jgi:peroxiredoxin
MLSKESNKLISMLRSNIHRLALLLLCNLAVMAYARAQKQTTVTVKIHNNAGNSVSLYKVEYGEPKRLSFRWPVNDTCIFSFPLEKEAVYFLGKTGGKSSDFNYVIYLKPGDDKRVEAYSSKLGLDFDSCKIVKANTETVLLQKWTNLFNQYCQQGINRAKRQQFLEAYGSFTKEAELLKKKASTTNKYFNRLFVSKIDAEMYYPIAAAFFNFGKRMNAGYDSTSKHQIFYQSLAGKRFCHAGLLYSEHGMQLLKYYLAYNLVRTSGSAEQMLATSFVDKAAMICNDSVRVAYALDQMKGITNHEQFKTDIQPFQKLFTTDAQKAAYQKKEDELTIYAMGAQAYNFSLEDTKGQMVSLADFKGKVVVLDIWAMWCAPCLTEKPFYVKVEEEFKDRDDIVFLGISHDGVSRKAVWKSFVSKKGWKNIELIADYNESVGKYYKIEGIPRFMVFDKEGRIVTVDAPRPSNPEFKKLIEETLNNKNYAIQ